MLKGLIAAVGMSLAAAAVPYSAAHAAFEKKVALVVGNGAYRNAPALDNPVTDAKAIAAAFERLGFETVTGYDLDKDGLEDTIRSFARASRKADLTAFFYAGHGIAFDDKNYIIPIDARFQDATALDFEAVGMDFVVKQMRYNDGVSLVFLDACRDNPLASTLTRSLGKSTRSAVSRGLADMDVRNAGRGLAIAFATSPGEVAYDGASKHSPFTSALLNNIEREGADITEVMSRVTGEVLQLTEDRQRPWLNASLTGPVVLKPVPAVMTDAVADNAVSPSPAAQNQIAVMEAETKLFNYAYEKRSVNHFETYLATYPNGLYAAIARKEIDRLNGEGTKGVEVAALTPADAENDADRASTATDVAALDPAAEAGVADEAEAAETEEAPAEATAETEAALELDREARREIQHRLNMLDADVGYADGLFGPRTRGGITKFQAENDFAETGYLDAAQVAVLEEATEEEFKAYVAEQERIAAAAAERRRAAAAAEAERRAKAAQVAKTRSVQKKATTTRRSAKRVERRTNTPKVVRAEPPVIYHDERLVRRQQQRNNAAAAAFVGGVVGGLIGGAIRY